MKVIKSREITPKGFVLILRVMKNWPLFEIFWILIVFKEEKPFKKSYEILIKLRM